MPFGLCNAPATFQCLVDVLAGLQWSSCLVYIDIIIIIGRSFEEHLHHLQQIHLKSAGLKIHPGKCYFLQQKVNFWGRLFLHVACLPTLLRHIESTNGQILSQYWKCNNFLGLANYYRYFIKDFATIAKPLHQSHRKEALL